MSLKIVPFYVAGVMSVLFLAACGDDVTEKTVFHDDDSISVLESGEKLSKQQCDSVNIGELLLVMDSNEVFLCNGEEWETLKGDTGARGDKGKTGAKGETGAKGKTGAKGDDGESLTGSAGPRGSTGADGLDGTGCNVVKEESGVVTIACGSDTTKLYRSMCGEKPYDADSLVCVDDKLYNFFVDDRDEQVYRYITIGEGKNAVSWMAENLNFEYNKGSAKSFCYDNLESNCDKYGRLYTWSAAVDSAGLYSTDCKGCGYYLDEDEWGNHLSKGRVRGACPAGWHIPDTTEFDFLLRYVATQDPYADRNFEYVFLSAAERLKAKIGWTGDAGFERTDMIGFSALPSGSCSLVGDLDFHNLGSTATFWTSADFSKEYTKYIVLSSYTFASRMTFAKQSVASSIRCVKD